VAGGGRGAGAIPPANPVPGVLGLPAAAPGFNANQVPSASQVAQERRYTSRVQELAEGSGYQLVMRAQLGNALIWEQKVVGKAAAAGGAPAWAQAQHQAVLARLDRLDARQENSERRTDNQRVTLAAGGQAVIQYRQKEVAGLPAQPHPLAPAGYVPFAYPNPPNVGEEITNHLPAAAVPNTVNGIDNLSQAQIVDIFSFYNVMPVNVVAGDPVGSFRTALRWYLGAL
jgi:hypothetical protein